MHETITGTTRLCVYEDEVDVHLNPKIGLDWMIKGQQKEVLTPGQNEKRHLAGALSGCRRIASAIQQVARL